MVIKIILLVSILLLNSCSPPNSPPNPEQNIPFEFIIPDIESKAIAENHIKITTIKLENIPNTKRNVLGYELYDEFGRIIMQIPWLYGVHHIEYHLDSLGNTLGKRYITDFMASFATKNLYYPKERKLLQFWYNSAYLNNKTDSIIGEPIDTTVFSFSGNGLLQSEKGYFHNDCGTKLHYSKNYVYDAQNRIFKIFYTYNWDYLGEDAMIFYMTVEHDIWGMSSITPKVEEHFKYGDKHLSEKHTIYLEADTIKREFITFYDSLGLKEKTIIKGEEDKRNPVFVRYTHSTKDTFDFLKKYFKK